MCNVERKAKSKQGIYGDIEKRNTKKKREKKALRQASPACDYERIRAANIAERMELLRTLDIEGSLAKAKDGKL